MMREERDKRMETMGSRLVVEHPVRHGPVASQSRISGNGVGKRGNGPLPGMTLSMV